MITKTRLLLAAAVLAGLAFAVQSAEAGPPAYRRGGPGSHDRHHPARYYGPVRPPYYAPRAYYLPPPPPPRCYRPPYVPYPVYPRYVPSAGGVRVYTPNFGFSIRF